MNIYSNWKMLINYYNLSFKVLKNEISNFMLSFNRYAFIVNYSVSFLNIKDTFIKHFSIKEFYGR